MPGGDGRARPDGRRIKHSHKPTPFVKAMIHCSSLYGHSYHGSFYGTILE